MIELLKEEEHVMVDMEFDIPQEDYDNILKYAKEVYPEEQHNKDMINYAMNKILREFVENNQENNYERDKDTEQIQEAQED